VNLILFDANSTSPISQIIAVAPGDCVLISSWGLTPGEVAQVYRALVALGNIPEQQSGSCAPPPQVTAAAIQTETPYFPCNLPVQVGEQPNQSLTTVLIQQPGFYRVHLTPSALGVAVVEAVVITGAEACGVAASQCCCLPEAFWNGSSLNPCLAITAGGPAGHEPVFDLDACCLLQGFPGLPAPQPTDELVVLSGGSCFRSTIAQVFDPAIICTTLGTYLLQLPVAGDTLVVVDAGANCKRVDGETFVEFFETPWTGISVTPALTIAPGGINGHGPTFAYDLCADLQVIPACACEPVPGDLVPIIQGGACVLATWPTVDVCDQIGVLPVGAPLVGDLALIREAGGVCKLVDPTIYAIPFNGGVIANPILGPNGSCATPTYSFTASPDSGMFYDPAGVGSVVIGDDNCTDFISIGASINITTAASAVNVTAGTNVVVQAVGGSASTTASTSVNLTAGSNVAIQGATNVQIAALGGFLGLNASVGFISVLANTLVSIGATLSTVTVSAGTDFVLNTGGVGRLSVLSTGAWSLAGNSGLAGQVITSAGPGLPPVWAAAGGGGVAEPLTQVVWGTGPGVDSDSFFLRDFTTGLFNVNFGAGLNVLTGAGNRGNVNIYGSRSNTGNVGGDVNIVAAASLASASQNGRSVNISGGFADTLDRQGGLVVLRGGNASGASFFAKGGNVEIYGGDCTPSGGNPGNIFLRPGIPGAGVAIAGNQGAVEIGRDTTEGIRVATRSNDLSWYYGHSGNLLGDPGQTVVIAGGRGNPGGGATDGGDVRLITGEPRGGGVGGRIDFFADKGAFDSPIAHMTSFGDTVLAGYGQGTNGTQDTTLLAGATTGFPWLARIAAAPVGVPAGTDIPGGTGYANPVVVQQAGGSIVLFIYDFSGAVWRSVTLV